MARGDVIRRKVAGAAAGVSAKGCGEGAERAWPLALARAARDCFALGLDVTGLSSAQRSVAEVVELAPDRSLIAVLDGPEDALGVLILSPELLSGLIEVQTLGRVGSGPVLPRRPTRTDAAMVAGWIDAALAGLELTLAHDGEPGAEGGFRYASFLDDARPLGLLLDDAPYRLLSVDVDLARGARQGRLLLALPALGLRPRPADADAAAPLPAASFETLIRSRVLTSDALLQALIARIRLPLGRVLDLAEGALLPLGEASVDHVLVESLDGRPLAIGRLGQFRGNRAIRLAEVFDDHIPATAPPGTADAVLPAATGNEPAQPLLRAG